MRAARQRRDARISLWSTLAVSLFYVVLLSAPLVIGSMVVMGNFRGQSEPINSAASNRTAHFSSPSRDGTSCRNLIFDNKTAQLLEDKVELCAHSVSQANSAPRFNWGGK